MKRLALLCLLFCFLLPAAPARATTRTLARDLRQTLTLSRSDGGAVSALLDGREQSYQKLSAGCSLRISAQEPVSSLYLVFDRIPQPFLLIDEKSGREVRVGEDSFLHLYLDIRALFGQPLTAMNLRFAAESTTVLADLYAYSDGALPDSVQVWQPPCEEADLLLISTHSDDDQLYFAGLLPTYTARGASVQVAYFIHHWDTHDRPHETLNGLWHAGVRHYPVISDFPDRYSESADAAKKLLERDGFSEDDVLLFQTRLLRRFRPLVVVGHDLAGEYGHGAHCYNARTLTEALLLAKDADYDPESAAQYGVWDTPRCYLHLYAENEVTADFDIPLEAFSGKTAFEVSKEAFALHRSQQVFSSLTQWIDHEKASEITRFSPCAYGLYYASEEAVAQADFFADMLTYAERAEQARREQEAAAEQEAAKQAAKDEQSEKSAASAAETAEAPAKRADIQVFWVAALAVLSALCVLLFCLLMRRRPKR